LFIGATTASRANRLPWNSTITKTSGRECEHRGGQANADLLKQLTQQWRDGWRKALPGAINN